MRQVASALGRIAIGALIASCGTPASGPIHSGGDGGGSASSTAAAAATPTPKPAKTVLAPATPVATTFDGLEATTLTLGSDVAPIDVIAAFGSIWIADHHANAVSRIDPVAMKELARIKLPGGGTGPGWFAITPDAIWVTNQTGRGLSRIDPATNTSELRVGQWPTCGAPAFFEGVIYQASCDTDMIMAIDATSNAVTDLDAAGHTTVGVVDGELIASGPDGLSRFRPSDGSFAPIGGCCGFAVGYDDAAVWLLDDKAIHRVAIADGHAMLDLPVDGDAVVSVAGDHAWVTVNGGGVSEVAIATGTMTRILRPGRASVAREIDGELWVTSFDQSTITRVRL